MFDPSKEADYREEGKLKKEIKQENRNQFRARLKQYIPTTLKCLGISCILSEESSGMKVRCSC